jgi:hypothetical protein
MNKKTDPAALSPVQAALAIQEITPEGLIRYRSGRQAAFVQVAPINASLLGVQEQGAFIERLLTTLYVPLAGRDVFVYALNAPPNAGAWAREIRANAQSCGSATLEAIGEELASRLEAQASARRWRRILYLIAYHDGDLEARKEGGVKEFLSLALGRSVASRPATLEQMQSIGREVAARVALADRRLRARVLLGPGAGRVVSYLVSLITNPDMARLGEQRFFIPQGVPQLNLDWQEEEAHEETVATR